MNKQNKAFDNVFDLFFWQGVISRIYNNDDFRWVGGPEIELIAIATGGRIVPRFQEC